MTTTSNLTPADVLDNGIENRAENLKAYAEQEGISLDAARSRVRRFDKSRQAPKLAENEAVAAAEFAASEEAPVANEEPEPVKSLAFESVDTFVGRPVSYYMRGNRVTGATKGVILSYRAVDNTVRVKNDLTGHIIVRDVNNVYPR